MQFPDIGRRIRQGRRLALARACDARPGLRVHDALAGWGTDALVLAALGCRVHCSERHRDVYAILDERLRTESTRLKSGRLGSPRPTPGSKPQSLGSIGWAQEDARDRWRASGDFDVVYLDPMFGEHPKTALPGRPMQVLARLVGEMARGEIVDLIDGARRVASFRVVVKRRANAEPLVAPDWQIRARSVRFDVYRPVEPTAFVP
ncbi:MAG: class I SAM-dependent methyltransferase [Gammaproteobacteria bacterium]|nr:class I SAM-dependent methyltransferase [Gammaproteobacteria bacterium]